MRIVGGLHRGRRLQAPPGRAVRPTSDRTRETVFNILSGGRLGGRDRVVEARVLDGFAGTGALGLEALSRGAAHAVFMEKSDRAFRSLRRNIEALREEKRAEAILCDLLHPPAADRPAEIVFLDPPYGLEMGAKAIMALEAKGWLTQNVLIVLETGAKDPFSPPPGFVSLEERSCGAARLAFIARGPDPAPGAAG